MEEKKQYFAQKNEMIWCLGFEVFTAMVMKSSLFWEMMSCSPMKVNWCFGGTCHFHIQGWRVSQARNQHDASSKKALLWRWLVPLKCPITFKGLHAVMYQKMEFFMWCVFSLIFKPHPIGLDIPEWFLLIM
jgi:hypothetical protein